MKNISIGNIFSRLLKQYHIVKTQFIRQRHGEDSIEKRNATIASTLDAHERDFQAEEHKQSQNVKQSDKHFTRYVLSKNICEYINLLKY